MPLCCAYLRLSFCKETALRCFCGNKMAMYLFFIVWRRLLRRFLGKGSRMKTVLEKAIVTAKDFLENQDSHLLDSHSCAKVSVYLHQSLPQANALGISYNIIFRKDSAQQWTYQGHQKFIPNIDFARVGEVAPILQFC